MTDKGKGFNPRPIASTPQRNLKESFVNPETQKLTADIDANLHRQLKYASIEEGQPMRHIIEVALDQYLNGKRATPGE